MKHPVPVASALSALATTKYFLDLAALLTIDTTHSPSRPPGSPWRPQKAQAVRPRHDVPESDVTVCPRLTSRCGLI